MRAASLALLVAATCTALSACPDGEDLTPDRDDAGADGREGEGEGEGEGDAGVVAPCDLADPGDADRARVVLVAQPFSATPGEDGTAVRGMTLSPSGTLLDDGARLDVGFRPARVAFAGSGAYALVLGEQGALASVEVGGASDLATVDEIALPAAGYGDLRVAADGRTFYVVGSNVDESSGVSVVTLACDGTLTAHAERFFPLRIAVSLALLGGGERALLLGGQTAFEPFDDDDVRLLDLSSGQPQQVGAFDVYGDFVHAQRIAASPDGRFALIPNDSPFSAEGHQVSAVEIVGDAVVERARLLDMPSASEALFSPDGTKALVSLFEDDRVALIDVDDGAFTVSGGVNGIGLADAMAQVERGALAGLVLLPSVDTSGVSNVAMVRFDDAEGVVDLGQVDLGTGSENIPGAVALQP